MVISRILRKFSDSFLRRCHIGCLLV